MLVRSCNGLEELFAKVRDVSVESNICDTISGILSWSLTESLSLAKDRLYLNSKANGIQASLQCC